MPSTKMHSLLRRQLKRFFGDAFEVPEEWTGFIDAVNSAYRESDTDRNMLERSLELSSQELLQAGVGMRAIFEAIPDIFFRIDGSGLILDCKTGSTSDLIDDRFGVLGRFIYDIPPGPAAYAFYPALEDMRRRGAPVSFEYSLFRRGAERFCEARLIPLPADEAIIIIRDITDRKTAESALRESEKTYRLLTEKMSDVVWIVDMNLQTVYVTPSVQAVLGYTQEERRRMPIEEQFTPESLAFGLSAFASELAREKEGNADPDRKVPLLLEYCHKDGTTRWMDTIIGGVRNNQGVLTGLHGVSRDITMRKLAEDSLQQSEQKYRELASYHKRLNDISIVFAEAASTQALLGKIAESLRLLTGALAATFSIYQRETRSLKLASLSIDPAADEKVGVFFGPELYEMRMPVSDEDMEDMLQEGLRRPKDLYELSFGAVPRELSDIVMQTGGCRQIIALAVSYAGEVIGACAAYLSGDQPVVPDDALKTFAYLTGMALNRKLAEETIRKSEERYRTIFESTATANIIIDEKTVILMANNNFAQLSGYSKQELEGKMSWTAFIHPDDLEKLNAYQALRRTDAGSAPATYEFRFINREGETRDIIINVAILPETKESVASLVDLTERKQLEKQLVQAQKMESVGRLAGGVAHDFNNMLGVIIGNAEMAIKKTNHGEPLYQSLHDILNAGMRSADLTRQLLAFARKQTVSPRVMDLNDTVTGMLKMLQRLIGENITLGWHPGRNLWKIKIDPSQIDQLLANLAVNARDAIDKTGQIRIETGNVTCDEAYCADRPEWVPGDFVILAVSDSGCGIARDALTNIFEPFFTTKKEGQGTGLGLATVYGIVKQNNGFINVYSEPGQGTTFRIYLPRYQSDVPEAAGDMQEAEIPRGTETILIVEDEATVLKLTKAMLEALGYRVLAAGDRNQALDLARENSEKIHLLLTDVVMPDMNGKELSERITAVTPGLKHLYMSGYTADVIARQGVLDDGVKLIAKPFSLKDLALKVREALDE
ncbi:MAG: PAS domain S-box protein [Deltaproteobacteria bacterium]|nr:PAS domain S-box protein [Deltaproteobacteria bacterium]